MRAAVRSARSAAAAAQEAPVPRPAPATAPAWLAARSADCPAFGLGVQGLRLWRDGTAVFDGSTLCLAPGALQVLHTPHWWPLRRLLHVLAGWHDAPAGLVHLDGRPLADWPPALWRATVAVVTGPGEPLPPCSTADLVAMGLVERTCTADEDASPGQAHDLVLATLQWLGLLHLAHTPCPELAPDARLLAQIGRALVQGTHYLLLDEPALEIPPSRLPALWRVLRQLADAGMGVLLTSRAPALPGLAADAWLHLLDGQWQQGLPQAGEDAG